MTDLEFPFYAKGDRVWYVDSPDAWAGHPGTVISATQHPERPDLGSILVEWDDGDATDLFDPSQLTLIDPEDIPWMNDD